MTPGKQEKLNRKLVKAVVDGRIRKTREIIDAGAKLDAVDGDGWTALHFVARDGHLGIAKLLLSRGANVDARNVQGWTPLDLAAWNGQETVAKLLLEHGADPADVAGRDEYPGTAGLIAEWNSPENVEKRRWAAVAKDVRRQRRRFASLHPPVPGL